MSASGSDVVTLLPAEGGLGTGVSEDAEKLLLARFVGSIPFKSLHGVVGNEVHLGIHTPRLLGKKTSLLGRVVDVADQNVFKSEPL